MWSTGAGAAIRSLACPQPAVGLLRHLPYSLQARENHVIALNLNRFYHQFTVLRQATQAHANIRKVQPFYVNGRDLFGLGLVRVFPWVVRDEADSTPYKPVETVGCFDKTGFEDLLRYRFL
ncbi:hypothetical protein B0H11DRAFT_1920120 [Mycena galericulata]|nr:hypothetical protein B0H11DRAFT_1920120 [Mycena galericulata]